MRPRREYFRSDILNHSNSSLNRSSEFYNIITNDDENKFSHPILPGILDKKSYHRKKGISEIRDLQRDN